jgi:hypothetical protein
MNFFWYWLKAKSSRSKDACWMIEIKAIAEAKPIG